MEREPITVSSSPQRESLYQCPCSKIYKSYPALYTHIKNKHQGKAPGSIVKPTFPPKKRGRPTTHRSRTSLESQLNIKSQTYLIGQFLDNQSSNSCQIKGTSSDCIQKITLILQGLPSQEINQSHLNQIGCITQMAVYLSTKKEICSKEEIGSVIAKFLSQLAKEIPWTSFKNMYTLLVLLLQYVTDTICSSKVMEEPMDTLCHHINDFIEFGVNNLVESYGLTDLLIFQRKTMLQLLSLFFRWLMVNNHISYRITLNQNLTQQVTQPQL